MWLRNVKVLNLPKPSTISSRRIHEGWTRMSRLKFRSVLGRWTLTSTWSRLAGSSTIWFCGQINFGMGNSWERKKRMGKNMFTQSVAGEECQRNNSLIQIPSFSPCHLPSSPQRCANFPEVRKLFFIRIMKNSEREKTKWKRRMLTNSWGKTWRQWDCKPWGTPEITSTARSIRYADSLLFRRC